jgi:AcrR family transcriptional regulator
MPAPARKRLPAEERELQILRAATKVFARSNYRVAGTAEIAREAGISEPTIYKYFGSKKELFLRILGRTRERILENWKQVVGGGQTDPASTLREMGRVYLKGLRRHSDELKIQFQALAESDDPEIARQLRENHKAYVEFFVRLINQGKNEGVMRADTDAYSAAWVLDGIGFTLTLVRLLGFDQQAGEERVAEMTERYVDWLVAGNGEGRPTAQPLRRSPPRSKRSGNRD